MSFQHLQGREYGRDGLIDTQQACPLDEVLIYQASASTTHTCKVCVRSIINNASSIDERGFT